MLCLSQMCLTLVLSLQRPLVLRIGRTSKRRLATCFSTPTQSQSAQCRSRPTDRGWCAVARTVTSQAPKVTECFHRLPQCISQNRTAQTVHRGPGCCTAAAAKCLSSVFEWKRNFMSMGLPLEPHASLFPQSFLWVEFEFCCLVSWESEEWNRRLAINASSSSWFFCSCVLVFNVYFMSVCVMSTSFEMIIFGRCRPAVHLLLVAKEKLKIFLRCLFGSRISLCY